MTAGGREPLHDWLRRNAERDARGAVRRAIVDEDYEPREFYELAGRSLELTLKAVFASIDTQLILDLRSSLKQRLDFRRSEVSWDDLAPRLRTIGMDQLLGDIGHVIPELGALAKKQTGPLRSLIDQRNAVQHVGDCSGAEVHDHAVALIEALHHCYANRGWSLPDALTQDLHDIAMSAWKGAQDEAFLNAQRALDRARRRLEELSDTPPAALAAMAEAWAAERLRDYMDYAPATCPVCDNPAVVDGWVEITEEYEPETRYTSGGLRLHASMAAFSFKCIVCGLTLEDDEIGAGQVEFDGEYELDGFAYDDYLQGLHDDWAEDLWRDR